MIRRLLLTLALLPTLAWAKSVRVKWKPVKGAAKYELEIGQADRVLTSTKLPATAGSWKGKFPPGYYYYRLRAVDAFEVPGEWSRRKVIVVWPKAPRPEFPRTGDAVKLSERPVELHWSIEEPADGFVVEWQRIPGGIQTSRLPGSAREFRIPDAKPGDYRWRLRAFVQPADRLPAELSHTVTDASSELTVWSQFKVRE